MEIATPSLGDTAAVRKARGAFFTPAALCDYMVDWAIRDPADAVLEPTCGEAAFLLSAARRLDDLGAGRARLSGVELHPESARNARAALRGSGHPLDLTVGDFLAMPPRPRFDAVIGNPPYVRYQDFAGEVRARSRQAALRAGVNLTNLASSWAAFTVHASLFLRDTGRLALVLPAELLSVNYAAEVRQFLMNRFASVRLVLFTQRVFPEVQEEVVLLLAENRGSTDHCELVQVRDAQELAEQRVEVSSWRPASRAGKWTTAMLRPDLLRSYAEVLASPGLTTLHQWGETTLGAVTGNNGWFTLSAADAAGHGLKPGRDLVPISPPGSKHLRNLALSQGAWQELDRAGRSAWLFFPADRPSAAARRYIAAGEAGGVHTAYKCRVRTPWWRVPLVPPADALLTYMNADTPRICANTAGVHHVNSVHGLYLHRATRTLGRSLLPVASLNTVTLLGAETVGRAYGGGMLKLEPREADQLPVPAPGLLESCRGPLEAARPRVLAALGAGRLLDAVALVDDLLLRGELGLPASELGLLTEARALLAGRRAARGRVPTAPR